MIIAITPTRSTVPYIVEVTTCHIQDNHLYISEKNRCGSIHWPEEFLNLYLDSNHEIVIPCGQGIMIDFY